MKIKRKDKPIPIFNSYGGLSVEDWTNLNAGETAEIKSVPDALVDYVEEVKEPKKVEEVKKPKKIIKPKKEEKE